MNVVWNIRYKNEDLFDFEFNIKKGETIDFDSRLVNLYLFSDLLLFLQKKDKDLVDGWVNDCHRLTKLRQWFFESFLISKKDYEDLKNNNEFASKVKTLIKNSLEGFVVIWNQCLDNNLYLYEDS